MKRFLILLFRKWLWSIIALFRTLQEKVNSLTSMQGKRRLHSSQPILFKRKRRCQAKIEMPTLENGSLAEYLDVMSVLSIVESRTTNQLEG